MSFKNPDKLKKAKNKAKNIIKKSTTDTKKAVVKKKNEKK